MNEPTNRKRNETKKPQNENKTKNILTNVHNVNEVDNVNLMARNSN